VLYAAACQGLTMRVVKQWVASADSLQKPLALLDELEAREAADQLRGVLEQEARSRASVIAAVATALHPYGGRVLDEASAATDADWSPEKFLSGQNSLFVIAPMDSEVDDPAPIVLGVMAEMYGSIRRLSDRNGGRLPFPTLWALDEVANICPLPRLPQWMAEAAGRGLSVILGAQDYAQLADRWGAEGAKAMWSNLSNKVVFPGISNPDTLAQLEALAGKQWVDQVSKSTGSTSGWRHGSQSSGTTTSQTERPRWPQAAIYGLQEGTCLVFRPEDQEPLHRWQSRAHLIDPFGSWQQMSWPRPKAIHLDQLTEEEWVELSASSQTQHQPTTRSQP
jgi:type IV secretory pathway TraG/TraD family ATPase VirD4